MQFHAGYISDGIKNYLYKRNGPLDWKDILYFLSVFDIETNENDSSGIIKPVNVLSTVEDSGITNLKEPGIFVKKEHIIAQVSFDDDSTGQYYLMADGSLVAIAESRMFHLGQLKEHDSNEFPYVIDSTTERLFIDRSGIIVNKERMVVGKIRKHS